ncbi:uncharacterized protein LOC132555196 [Ylistrum balloti]|uniref:uncharacterized protein LOC132555196 n=1 Tax=Ylistrum balloti TaxID=509963 RepID=UPI002905BFC3|nr:uncharacterized protein LOC132555196 [Ylistrum balloti]
MITVRRKLAVMNELIVNAEKSSTMTKFNAGSRSDGSAVVGSDQDTMYTYKNIVVLSPDQAVSRSDDIPVLMMRDAADSRPGYVFLELVKGWDFSSKLSESIVPVGDKFFVSSEVYSRTHIDGISDLTRITFETNGPASGISYEVSPGLVNVDTVMSLRCPNWPKEANEWVIRPRLHGWPNKTLRDQIVRDGCHLVPVGDKTSGDSFLQWRISFVTAERKLLYSLSHVQFLVYGLLKCFLQQISEILKELLGNIEILTSYIMKTIILHAVESTHHSLWQDRNIFYCFMLCLKILIGWVETGYCPNYFIKSNNMFLGKVNGKNQEKLLRFLIDLHDLKWECLSVNRTSLTAVGEIIEMVRNGEWESVLYSPAVFERKRDEVLFNQVDRSNIRRDALPVLLEHLSASKSELDEFLSYVPIVSGLTCEGIAIFGEHRPIIANKEKYKFLRKCKKFLTPFAGVSTSPGLLALATYHYHTGNYPKALEICGHMITSVKIHFGFPLDLKEETTYNQVCCGRGYSLLHKFREICVSDFEFKQNDLCFCPPQLHPEFRSCVRGTTLLIPPLPYAVFLSFLCYHELGDIRRRDAALIHLRIVKYDKKQGGSYYWIVHNLLGICYEIAGDTRGALREYRNSLGV